MFSHVTIGANDLEAAGQFYDKVLGTLGIERFFAFDGGIGYGAPNQNQTWILKPYDGQPATPGNGVHVAYFAETRTQVRAFHEAALAASGSDEGPPGLRAHYHPNYYGAYVRDPEGNKLQAVCHRAEAKAGS